MMQIAVLITCHNRKNTTLDCLRHLFKASEANQSELELSIYITDDGSNDGTTEAILKEFTSKNIHILKGNGSLYWAGGMRNSWREALKSNYDIYLLLNDDTKVFMNIINEMIKTHEYCISQYGHGGIYVGSTKDELTNKLSYGGSVITSKLLNKSKRLEPNNTIQVCDLGNANIMFVTGETVKKIGILSDDYVHGIADYDYTLTATNKNIPVLIMAAYCGECSNNHRDSYERFSKMSISDRIKFLYNPIGLAFLDQQKFMKKFYPFRLPFIIIAGWGKVFFPRTYIYLNKLR